LLEQVSCSFEFSAAVAGEEFREIQVPQFKGDGVREMVYSSFVDTEGFFVVAVFFEEVGIVDDDLGSCDPKIKDSFVDFFGGFKGAATFF